MKSLRQLRVMTCLATALIAVPALPAAAAIVSTEQSASAPAGTTSRDRIDALLSREDVARQMAAQGVNPDEARRRLAGLSDQEVQQLANRIDHLPAGGAVASFTDQQLIVILLALILLALVL